MESIFLFRKIKLYLKSSRRFIFKLILPSFLYLTVFYSSFGQSYHQDSIVKFCEIHFNSDFEKDYFQLIHLQNDKQDLFPIFIASDANCTPASLRLAQNKMEEVFSYLQKDGLNDKTEAKKIKTIYNYVHSSFLSKYELENNFSDIFKEGKYNCVSATALYAIVLERFKIPYIIKKAPTHVFLIAYPQTFKFLIETTDPVTGYFQFNEVFVNKYIEELKKTKMISEQEYTEKSKTELFNKYFLKDEDINLKQLVGIQYYNLGVFNYEKEKYKDALQNFQKAYFFYPSEGTKYLLKNALLVILSKSNYESLEDVKNYIFFSRIDNADKNNSNVQLLEEEFERITKKQLLDKSNFDLYKQTYQYISKNISGSTLNREIEFIYNYEMARAVLNTDKDKDIEINLQRMYVLKPENIYVQSMINSYVINKISSLSNPTFVLSILNKYSTNYKFLTSNTKVGSAYSSCYLQLAANSFLQNNLKKGEENLIAFEEFMKGKDNEIINEFFIEKSYSEAAAAYYRKGNYAKSKMVLKKALEYVPDNFNLKLRLNSLH